MSWNIKELDKAKTEQSIANETIRLENCHETVEKLIREADQLRTAYEKKYYAFLDVLKEIARINKEAKVLILGRNNKDFEDIETKEVTENLDWKLMDRLIEDVCYGMLNEYDENHLRMRYENYKERFM